MLAGLQRKRQTVLGATQLLDTAEYLVSTSLDAGLVTRNDLMKVQLKRDELVLQRLQLENGIRLTTNLLAILTDLSLDAEPTLQPSPEEKLLRAIFGDKAGDVKDSSLKANPSLTLSTCRFKSPRQAPALQCSSAS